MDGLLIGQLVSNLNEMIKSVFQKIKDNYSWDGLFLNSGNEVIVSESDKHISVALQTIFSEENMRELAEELRGTSDYNLLNNLEARIASRLKSFDICDEIINRYTDYFICEFSSELAKKFPEIYDRCYLGEMKRQSGQHAIAIQQSLNALIEVKKVNANYYSVSQLNEYLQMATGKTEFTLEFFKVDDYVFQERFQEVLSSQKVCIVGNSLEETRYCVIHELVCLGYSENIIIVKDIQSWKQLMNYGIHGKILIPMFIEKEIPVIKNNTNIFIFEKNYLVHDTKHLELRRRTKSTIYRCLTNAGYRFDEVNKLMNQTNGIYSLLKGKLFVNVALYDNGLWGTPSPSLAILTALLCGQWTENDQDKEIIRQISGMPYEHFVDEISPYIGIDFPLVMRNSSKDVISYKLACCEDAWGLLGRYIEINKALWERYVSCLKLVAQEVDPKFDLPLEQHSFASIIGKQSRWSNSLKEGLVRTLTMKAIYVEGYSSQHEVDLIVSEFLQGIHSEKQWLSISGFIDLLCEASPWAVLEKLEQSIDNEDFLSVFRRQSDDIFSPVYYVHYLMVLERLTSLQKYCSRAIQILVKLAGHDIKFRSNSPIGVLKDIFCVWMNIIPLSSEKKLQLAKKMFDENDFLWDVFSNELPERHKSMVSSVSLFHYRASDEVSKYTMKDVYTLSIGYLKLCLEHTKRDSARWKSLLSVLYHYDISLVKEAFASLSDYCSICSDDDKIIIKNALRKKIHHHQYCFGRDWAMNQEYLDLYLEMMESIHTQNLFYEYLYFFYPSYHFPLLNPEHIDTKFSHQKNSKRRNDEIRRGFQEFVDRSFNMIEFAQFVEEKKDLLNENSIQTGAIFAEFYCDNTFDLDFALDLLKLNHKVFDDYCVYLLRKDAISADEILVYTRDYLSDEEVAAFLGTDPIQNRLLLESENDEVKKHCWGRYTLRIKDEISLCDRLWAVDQCCKYGTIDSLLLMLYDFRTHLTNEQIFNAVIRLRGMRHDSFHNDFILKELLEQLYAEYEEDDEKSLALVYVELFFRQVLEWGELKFLNRMMEKNPESYASILAMIFRKDSEADDKQDDEEKVKLVTSVYDLYYKAQFCPAEKSGKVDEEELQAWLNGFIQAMENFDLKSQTTSVLGRLFAYAPVGEDGLYPCEPVREMIEKMYDERLHSSFSASERKKRGDYTESAGFEELRLSKKYKENADGLSVLYPKTASIYYSISESYRYQSIRERERAENE